MNENNNDRPFEQENPGQGQNNSNYGKENGLDRGRFSSNNDLDGMEDDEMEEDDLEEDDLEDDDNLVSRFDEEDDTDDLEEDENLPGDKQ